MIIHKKYPSTKKLWRGKFIYMLIAKVSLRNLPEHSQRALMVIPI